MIIEPLLDPETANKESEQKMCFSASASFVASALLIPTGIYCLTGAMTNDKADLLISTWPLFFGIQQAFEGLLWLGIASQELSLVNIASLCFLVFSHFFWLFWVPFSAFSLETKKSLRIVLMIFTILGFFYGAVLYFPLLLDNSWVRITVVNSSIYYATKFIFNDLVPKNFSFVTYAIIILVPLLISSNQRVNFLGSLISLSVIITYIMFSHAFISVWCFFAAVVSLYLLYSTNKVARLNSRQSQS